MIEKGKGFTLIELIIVMLLITIMSAAAYELLGNTTTTKDYGTARKIQSDLSYAQGSAMSHHVHFRILFTSSPNGYTVQQCNAQATPCPGWTNTTDPSTNTAPFIVTLNQGSYSGVTLDFPTQFNGNYLEFNSAGTPFEGAGLLCATAPCPLTGAKVLSLNGGVQTVTIIPGTGEITVP